MFCNQCGHENRNDRKFCSECGAELRDYTKERENLIMPDELKNETAATENYNKKHSRLTIASNIVFLVADILLVISFVIKNETLQLVDLGVCLVLFVAYFVLIGVRTMNSSKRKKELASKDISKDEKHNNKNADTNANKDADKKEN